MPLRLVFMGTPDFAVPTLRGLHAGGHAIAAVYTRAPRPAGRGLAPRPSPVEAEARALGIPVLTPATLKTPDAANAFSAHRADAAVVVAYGLLLPRAILDAPRFGCFNLHASLLPRWRGAAPIQRAVMAGDGESGACVMRMEEGLDTGPVAACVRVPIGPDTTAGELHDTLSERGAALMAEAMGALERGGLSCAPQPAEGATYAHKIEKGETRIAWTRPAQAVHDHCRGLAPFPGAWFELIGEDGKPARVKVLRTTLAQGGGAAGAVLDAQLTVGCGEGAVRILELQRAGRAPMSAEAFLRGTRLAPGTKLG